MSQLRYEELHPEFGASVRGVDLGKPLTPELTQEINAAIDRYSFVCFPDQSMDDDRQLALTRQFGNPEPSHTSVGRIEYFGTIGNVQKDGTVLGSSHKKTIFLTGNNMWHSDASFKPVPAFLSIMCAYETPAEGGTTMFVSLRAAYDRLSPERKAELDPLIAIHDYVFSRSKVAPDAVSPEMAATLPPVRQRLVRTNPATGARNLFLGSHVREIEGMSQAAGRALIDELTEAAIQPEHVYDHAWQPGDVVFWDNRCLSTPEAAMTPIATAATCARPASAERARRWKRLVSRTSSAPGFRLSKPTSRIGTISCAAWIGRGLVKVQSSSMQFVAMRCRSSCLTPTSRNRRGRPSPAMKRSSTSAAGWPAAPSAALISAWRSALTVGVERQHGRQHDAGGVAVRHPGAAAQHMADGVARPHARAADDAGHRDPGADLAVEPRRQVGRIAFHRRQPAAEQAQRLQRRAVGVGVAVDRAVGLDRMIDRADAGREPQPFRRVHGDGGIEDHRERDDAGMDVGLLQPQPRLGDAGACVEFAAAQRGRHADLPHPRRAVLREAAACL